MGAAFLIVFGGTLGAILIQTPKVTFMRALKIASWMIKPPVLGEAGIIPKIVNWSNVARKEGLLGLEPLEGFGAPIAPGLAQGSMVMICDGVETLVVDGAGVGEQA